MHLLLHIHDVMSFGSFHASALQWHPDKHQGSSQVSFQPYYLTYGQHYVSLVHREENIGWLQPLVSFINICHRYPYLNLFTAGHFELGDTLFFLQIAV